MQSRTRQSLDANLVNSIVKATITVLQTMANTPVAFTEVAAQENYHPTGDISAIIGILGERGEGMFALSLTTPLASMLVSRLLGILPDDLLDEDRVDGVGELINMISGNAKAILTQGTDTVYSLTLPTVISGKDHQISKQNWNSSPYLIFKFDAEGEIFNLQVTFKNYSL